MNAPTATTHAREWPLSLDQSVLVTRWSHIDFETPLPLVPRWSVRVGDVIVSSHYGKRRVTDVKHLGNEGQTTWLEFDGSYHDARGILIRFTESYSSEMHVPVIERGPAWTVTK